MCVFLGVLVVWCIYWKKIWFIGSGFSLASECHLLRCLRIDPRIELTALGPLVTDVSIG